jgi:hypothetical protein
MLKMQSKTFLISNDTNTEQCDGYLQIFLTNMVQVFMYKQFQLQEQQAHDMQAQTIIPQFRQQVISNLPHICNQT